MISTFFLKLTSIEEANLVAMDTLLIFAEVFFTVVVVVADAVFGEVEVVCFFAD